jgi:hypothetical protein
MKFTEWFLRSRGYEWSEGCVLFKWLTESYLDFCKERGIDPDLNFGERKKEGHRR